jgi:LCP family protein required for cell wall assembly
MTMKIKRIFWVLMIGVLLCSSLGAARVQAAPDRDGACNGPDQPLTILVVGTDSRSRGYTWGNGDAVMVFRVDFQEEQVDVMSFPRDLWVEIPDLEELPERTHGKLSMAYFYGVPGMDFYSGEGYGAGLMAETLKVNYGLEIDRYIVINMRIFSEVIDALGGVKIYNPYPVYSHNKGNKPVYPQGGYFFGGREAGLYARYRDPRNVLDRVDRHGIVLDAVCQQIFSPEVVLRIPRLFSVFKGNLLTDMHLAELSRLLCLASRVGLEGVAYHRIPKDTLYHPDWVGSVWLEKEPGSIRELMAEFQTGTLEASQPEE